VWDANSWREVATLQGHDDIVWVCTWSPDGTRLASASSDKTVIVWNPNTG
jgi:WD40 repeat protein